MIGLNFIKKLCTKYTAITKENYPQIIIASCMLLPFIIFLYVSYPHSSNIEIQTKNQNAVMLNKLKEIDKQIQIITQNPNQDKIYEALQIIQKDAAILQKSVIDVAKKTDIQNVSNQITGIDNQINDLRKAVSSNLNNKQVLDPDVLPFHVISIDVIAGQPYVSVDYANHILPMAISDSLSGWRINSVDYDSNVVEFVNEKNQFVHINIKGS